MLGYIGAVRIIRPRYPPITRPLFTLRVPYKVSESHVKNVTTQYKVCESLSKMSRDWSPILATLPTAGILNEAKKNQKEHEQNEYSRQEAEKWRVVIKSMNSKDTTCIK